MLCQQTMYRLFDEFVEMAFFLYSIKCQGLISEILYAVAGWWIQRQTGEA